MILPWIISAILLLIILVGGTIIYNSISNIRSQHDSSLRHLTQQLKTMTELRDSLYESSKNLIVRHAHEMSQAVEEARADTLRRSRSTLRGQATEHLAPFMMEGMNPKDCRFMGSPVDYLIIDGLSAVLDGEEESITVYLVDIKTGRSQMTKAQRRIRDAIQAGRLVFGVFNPDDRSFVEYKYIEE